MRTITITPTLLLAVALAMPVSADHCTTYETRDAEIDTGETSEGRFYVDFEVCQMKNCWVDVWIYEESNGIDGLQRGDEVYDNTCHGMIRPDTIIF